MLIQVVPTDDPDRLRGGRPMMPLVMGPPLSRPSTGGSLPTPVPASLTPLCLCAGCSSVWNFPLPSACSFLPWLILLEPLRQITLVTFSKKPSLARPWASTAFSIPSGRSFHCLHFCLHSPWSVSSLRVGGLIIFMSPRLGSGVTVLTALVLLTLRHLQGPS